MLTDLLLELRAHQDTDPEFVAETGRANMPDGRYVLHCYRMPVTFDHLAGGEVDVTVNLVIGAGMRSHGEERNRLRDLSVEFVTERLPDGFEVIAADRADRTHDDGSFVLHGKLSLDLARSEIERITSAEVRAGRLLAARYKTSKAYVTYDNFLSGPKKPMGLSALKKASQRET